MDYLKPLDLVSEADQPMDVMNGPSFEVDPDVMYPVVIAHIRAQLQVENWVAPEHLRTHAKVAETIDAEAWDAALVARDKVSNELVISRGRALECARGWFTAALHAAIGGQPMNLRILKNADWRL